MKKNILVTAVGGRSVGAGILHALMRSSETVHKRWNVIAADMDPFAWGLYVVDQAVLLPSASAADYISALLNVIEKYRIDAVIPGSEAEVNILAAKKQEIPIPVICNRAELMPLMLNKFKMIGELQELGLPYIETYHLDEWEQATKEHGFPLIIKPAHESGGSKGLHLIFNEDEMHHVLLKLQKSSQKYCVQPYVGSQDQEYTVGVLSDFNGKIIDSIVMQRKLTGLSLYSAGKHNEKTYSVSSGYSQGYFIKHPQIQSFCEHLALLLGSQGPLNIQLRLHEGKVYVFEIHPRFSGSCSMRADVGFNEADILLRNALFNEQFTRQNYQYNVAAIRSFQHVIVPMHRMITP